MTRRYRSTRLCAALVLFLALVVPQQAAAQSNRFSDVPAGVYYATPVASLASDGVFVGTECNEGFCPDKPIDRLTMAVWMIRVLGGDLAEDAPLSFTKDGNSIVFGDLDHDDWRAPYVYEMARLEITTGCGQDPPKYCPSRIVNRAEMAAFLTRAFHLPDAPALGSQTWPTMLGTSVLLLR